MKSNVVWSLVLGVGIGLAPQYRAEACGLKLTAKSTKIQRTIAPSKNPSRVLILGSSSSSHETALKKAGHAVEHANTINDAKANDYQVVLVSDEALEGDAKSQWSDAEVLAMRSSPRTVVAMVEKSLERKPIATREPADSRTLRATGPTNTVDRPTVRTGGSAEESPAPIATGGKSDEQPVLAAKAAPPPEEEPEVAEPDPAPEPVAPPKPVVAKKETPKPEPRLAAVDRAPPVDEEERPARPSGKKGPGRVSFSLSSVRLRGSAPEGVKRHAAYLRAHPSATVRLSGHTDAIGSNEVNQILSDARVDSVKSLLVRSGVEESRIEGRGYGEENPPFPPSSDPKNRCVIIEVRE